jgi:hypothetical protein
MTPFVRNFLLVFALALLALPLAAQDSTTKGMRELDFDTDIDKLR